MGINTGMVVVGKIGGNLRMHYTAVGNTTNLAARLQQHAEPGAIRVSEATHRAALPYFEFTALGNRVLWLEGRALSFGRHLSYWPFIEILKRCFGIANNDAETQA